MPSHGKLKLLPAFVTKQVDTSSRDAPPSPLQPPVQRLRECVFR